ncbi:acylphosphatase [bacterium]
MKHVNITVKGYVQGIGFRFFAKAKARSLNINGWAQNLANGNVYIEAEADKELLEKFIENLKTGFSFSSVESVDLDWQDELKGFKNFNIRI